MMFVYSTSSHKCDRLDPAFLCGTEISNVSVFISVHKHVALVVSLVFL